LAWWPSGSGEGLQNPSRRFNSAPGLQKNDLIYMNILTVSQLILALILIIVVLLQQQGSGLGGAFGGDGNVYRSRRGIERFLFIGTIIIAFAFFGVAIASIILTNK
jgi:preprotein translocase subunit SecG